MARAKRTQRAEARRRYRNYLQQIEGEGEEPIEDEASAPRASARAIRQDGAPVVRPGQKIRRGDLLGYVGKTGKALGPHLHYEIRINNSAVNPYNYILEE